MTSVRTSLRNTVTGPGRQQLPTATTLELQAPGEAAGITTIHGRGDLTNA